MPDIVYSTNKSYILCAVHCVYCGPTALECLRSGKQPVAMQFVAPRDATSGKHPVGLKAGNDNLGGPAQALREPLSWILNVFLYLNSTRTLGFCMVF